MESKTENYMLVPSFKSVAFVFSASAAQFLKSGPKIFIIVSNPVL